MSDSESSLARHVTAEFEGRSTPRATFAAALFVIIVGIIHEDSVSPAFIDALWGARRPCPILDPEIRMVYLSVFVLVGCRRDDSK